MDASMQNRERRVMILCRDRARARTDRAFLARMRVRVAGQHESGVQAAEALLAEPAHAVLCDEQLADMSCLEFLALTRLHPKLAAVPVIALSTDNTLDAVLAAMDSGCSGYLIRPYSLRSFARNLHRVLDVHGPGYAPEREEEEIPEVFRAAMQAFAPPLQEPDPAAESYAEGAEHLAAQRFDEAALCFGKAARINPLLAEAHEGLARVWKAKGRPDLMRECLEQATVAMLRQGRKAEAGKAVSELTPSVSDLHEPVLDAAGKQLRRGDFQAAGEIYAQALALNAPEERILAHVTRNCHFTPDPGHAARAMCQELHAAHVVPDPAKAFARLMGPVELGPAPVRSGRSGPRPLTLLREALAVANYTFQAFRHNGAA